MRRPSPLLEAMPSRVAGTIWPPVMDEQLAVLVAQIEALEASQWLSPEEIDAGQRAQLLLTARHHARHSAFFARRLRAAGLTPENLAAAGGLARLPVIGRRDLQRGGDSVFARQAPASHLPVGATSTSGSTGEPVAIRRTSLNRLDWQAHVGRMHLWHTDQPGLRFAALRAKLSAVTEHPDWGTPATLLMETGPLIGIPNNIAITEQRRLLAAFRPDILLLYPSNMAALIEADRGAPAFRPRQLRTIGETLSPEVRAMAEAHWGCAVVDCYSSEEVGYIAMQCPDGAAYHAMAETLIVEILDEAGRPVRPGENGRVVLTDLRNFAMPLIRYDIGDRAEAGHPCGCGRGLPTIARVLGRERSLILMPDGSRHWPLTGRSRYRGVAPVVQFQLIQTTRERIEVRLVVERPLTGAEDAALRRIMIEALGHPFTLDFLFFEERLPLGPTGKLEEFLCRVEE